MVARIASDDREFLEQYECFAHYFLSHNGYIASTQT